jgi:hypothetical protein
MNVLKEKSRSLSSIVKNARTLIIQELIHQANLNDRQLDLDDGIYYRSASDEQIPADEIVAIKTNYEVVIRCYETDGYYSVKLGELDTDLLCRVLEVVVETLREN